MNKTFKNEYKPYVLLRIKAPKIYDFLQIFNEAAFVKIRYVRGNRNFYQEFQSKDPSEPQCPVGFSLAAFSTGHWLLFLAGNGR
jgi:hypothetical protein